MKSTIKINLLYYTKIVNIQQIAIPPSRSIYTMHFYINLFCVSSNIGFFCIIDLRCPLYKTSRKMFCPKEKKTTTHFRECIQVRVKVLDNKLHSYTNNSDLNFKEAKEASARGVWIFSGKRIQVIELQYIT